MAMMSKRVMVIGQGVIPIVGLRTSGPSQQAQHDAHHELTTHLEEEETDEKLLNCTTIAHISLLLVNFTCKDTNNR